MRQSNAFSDDNKLRRIAIPVSENRGMMSPVSRHFGKSEGFIIVNADGTGVVYLDSVSARTGGECAPIQALHWNGVEDILCYSMGRGAYARCLELGLRIFQLAMGNIVSEVLSEVSRGQLKHFGEDGLCASHDNHRH